MLRSRRLLRPRVVAAGRALLAGAAALVLLVGARGAGSIARETPLDPTEGSILGTTAVAFMASEAGEPQTILDYSLFEVHLVPGGGSDDEELVFPSGEWFLPPPGKYKVWMEGAGRMSPHPVVLNYSGGPFEGRGVLTAMEVQPAGTVALAADVELGPLASMAPKTTAMRLLYINDYKPGELIRNELSRRVPGDRVRTGVLMPEGQVVAALFDNSSRQYVGLSPPAKVTAGARTEVRPMPPEAGAHVIAALEGHDLDDLEVWLDTGVSKLRPSVENKTAHRLYAIWYDATPGQARLEVSSPHVYLEPLEVVLKKARIERLSGELRPLPNVEVELEFPEGFPADDLRLKVLTRGRTAEVRTVAIAAEERLAEVPALPAAELEVILETQAGPYWQRLDLRHGLDERLVFQPESLPVAGTIYWGEAQHAATVSFRGDGEKREPMTTTDPEGNYEAVLFKPLSVVTVWLDGVDSAPYRELVSKRIHELAALDIHVPKTSFEVRVVDAVSGEAIPGALVSSHNETVSGDGHMQSLISDAQGVARLQPLRVGKTSLMAKAKGYLSMSGPLEFEIGEYDTEGEFEVALVPEGPTAGLRLLLPDGRRPAARCELMIVSSAGEATPPVWSGACDEEGLAQVPRGTEGLTALVRHPEAGFLIRNLRSRDFDSGSSWTLPARAASPLALRVHDGFGAPIPWADIAVWVDNVRVQGPYLSWLAGTRQSVADGTGFWIGDNFPARLLEVVAWGVHSRQEAEAGGLDALATLVPYPWSGEISISGLD